MAETLGLRVEAGPSEGIALPSSAEPSGWRQRAWLLSTTSLTIGAMTTAVVLAPRQSATPLRSLAWLLFLGSSVHVASTGWLFTLPEVRGHAATHRTRYVTIPIALVMAAGLVASLLSPKELEWVLLPYFCWQFFHFQKQNLGLSALAASSHGARPLSRSERRALIGAGIAGIVGLVAHPNLLQLHVGSAGTGLFALAGLLFAVAVTFGLAALLRRPRCDRPTGFCVMYVVALLFSLPVFVFTSPYAAVGGMTVAHGFQYLLLVGLVAAGSGRGSTRALRIARLGNVALVAGALLSGASHLHSSGLLGRFLFGAYLGVVMTHFVIDAGLWRMRDAFPRAFMNSHVPYLMAPSEAHHRVSPPIDRPPI
ncbi:MAG: hypothetical protein ABSF33_08950 [Acidimicrobiales bacterium]